MKTANATAVKTEDAWKFNKTRDVWEYGDFQTPPDLAEKACQAYSKGGSRRS